MPMTGSIDRVEVITSVQRRRRWSAEEKARTVQETYAPGMSVSLVARQHGLAPNQVFKWQQLYAEGSLSAVGAGEEVVAASEYRALQHQVRELQRLLGKKTFENEILREALDLVQPKKRSVRSPLPARGYPMRRVAQTLGVARSNLVVQTSASTTRQRRGRRPEPEDELLAEIKAAIAGQPTYGYRRVHALLRRQRCEQGALPVNVKRVYRVIKAHGFAERHTGKARNTGMTGASPWITPIRGGVRTGLRSAATTANGCASPSPSTAATVRRSPGWRQLIITASTAATSAT